MTTKGWKSGSDPSSDPLMAIDKHTDPAQASPGPRGIAAPGCPCGRGLNRSSALRRLLLSRLLYVASVPAEYHF